MSDVQIRDRRELPYFQIRLQAVEAIRNSVSGPWRARTIGFYTVCCDLANEQRATGDHRRFVCTQHGLAARAHVSTKSIRRLIDSLESAGVLRYELLQDRERGAMVSIFHLPMQDGAFVALTLASSERLQASHNQVLIGKRRGYLTRDLGVLVSLLEFCWAQRDVAGERRARVQRAELARRNGLSIDTLDDTLAVLQAAGMLQITTERAANGGRYLPSIYDIIEPRQLAPDASLSAPSAARRHLETAPVAGGNSRGGSREITGRQTENGQAAPGLSQDGAPESAGRCLDDDREAYGQSQGGKSATPDAHRPPSMARARTEKNSKPEKKNKTPPYPPTRQKGGDAVDRESL